MCPLDTFKMSKSHSEKIVKVGKFDVVIDKMYSRDYGYMFGKMPFLLYGKNFMRENPDEAQLVFDKQATGYINLDQMAIVAT